jgi:hypothetical protein
MKPVGIPNLGKFENHLRGLTVLLNKPCEDCMKGLWMWALQKTKPDFATCRTPASSNLAPDGVVTHSPPATSASPSTGHRHGTHC